jgi:hypothetical protein
MGRDKLLAALRELSDRGHGAAGFKPHYVIEQEILAEFDRLTTENEKLKATPVAKLYMEAVADRFELLGKLHQAQAQLAKICLPIKIYGDVGHIRRTVIPLLCEQCKDISAQTLERVLDYLDSQKPDDSEIPEPLKKARESSSRAYTCSQE